MERIKNLACFFLAIGAIGNSNGQVGRAVEVRGFLARFSDHCEKLAIEPDLQRRVLDRIQAGSADGEPEYAITTECLAILYRDYALAMSSLNEEESAPDANVALHAMRDHSDPFLRAEVIFQLARASVMRDEFEQATPLLEELLLNHREVSANLAEGTFLLGISLANGLEREQAIARLEEFIREYPQASARMRYAAQRRLETLRAWEDGKLSEVYNKMEFSRRKLSLRDVGDATRARQKEIVESLAKLIAQAEDSECKCRGGKGKSAGKKSSGKGGDPGEGEGQGKGEGKQNPTKDDVSRMKRPGPKSPWGNLRDRDRDPVFQAIQQRFPGKYSELLEEYYRSFQDESSEDREGT